jgi:hypothetical protein
MKFLLPFSLVLITSTAFAQTKDNRLGLAAGGGPQYYHGDLGTNGIQSNRECWRGAVVFRTDYYLNRSLDASLFGSVGDLGYCQPKEVARTPIAESEQCPGCEDRTGLGNLSSRGGAVGFGVRYKFNNGYLLPEKSRTQPYLLLGTAINNVTDRMKMNCVNEGKYFSLNAAAGVRYYVGRRVNLGYQVSVGRFTSDNIDYMNHGGTDMYIQSSLMLGVDLL